MPADIAQEARAMQTHEEAFAAAWIDAVTDPTFVLEIRERRREAMALFRTASRPMHLIMFPEQEVLDDEDAIALGKIWKKLDSLADALGVQPLSNFITFGDEGNAAGVPACDVLPTVDALLVALESPNAKFPSRKKAVLLLGKVRDSLLRLNERGGRAAFEVDI